MRHSLKNHFLIAMPNVQDPYFTQSVVYLCDHTENGAIGIIVNQPLLSLRLYDILGLTHTQPHSTIKDNPLILSGGPVQKDRGFILHPNNTQWESTIPLNPQLSLTISADILEAIAHHRGPSEVLIALGFSNWTADQLEQEITKNLWLHTEYSDSLLFQTPIEKRWQAAAALIGVDFDRLSHEIGHA